MTMILAGIFAGENFCKFYGFRPIQEILTAKIFIECRGVIINGRVIILDNGDIAASIEITWP